MPQEHMDRAVQALARVDAASTKCGEATTNIAARIDKLVAQIKDAVSLESAKALADGLSAEADQLEAVAAALMPLGHDAVDPVPVPPPEPTPV